MFNSVHLYLSQHKDMLESFVVFYGWILKISGYMFLPVALLIFLTGNSLFATTALGAAIGLVIIGTVVTREYSWSGIALVSLLIAVGLAIILVPYGVSLIFVFLLQAAASIAAFIVCGSLKQTTIKQKVFSLLLTLVFVNFIFAHAQPQLYGMNLQQGSDFLEGQFTELSTAEPAKLIEIDEMRKQIIAMYNLSLFANDEEIIKAVEENPQPLQEFQNALPYTYTQVEDSLFGYVASIYVSLISDFK